MTRRVLWLLTTTLLIPTDISAQTADPIGPFVADVRLVVPRYKEDNGVASALGVSSTNLPTRGLGIAGGAHWYPARLGIVTLGLGGEILASGGSNSLDPGEGGGIEGATVNTKFSTISPQVSLNFGRRQGWSYLTGGLGWANFRTERENLPVADGQSRPHAFNYGGGARWFVNEHLAVNLDLRFYAVSAQEATVGRPAYSSMTIMVISGGVSFK
jgi:outer membrane protein with beta-barrel domain